MRPFKPIRKNLILFTLTIVLAYGGGFYLSQNPELRFRIFGAKTDRIALQTEEANRFSPNFRWSLYRSTGLKLLSENANTQDKAPICLIFGTAEFLEAQKPLKLPVSFVTNYNRRLAPAFLRYSKENALLIAWKIQDDGTTLKIVPHYLGFLSSCPEIIVKFMVDWWLGPINYLSWLSENPDLNSVRGDLVSPPEQSPERIRDYELNKIAPTPENSE